MKVALRSVVGSEGAEAMVACGSVVSTVNERLAGVGSTLPAASSRRTAKVYAPSPRAEVVWARLQVAKSPPSSEHSKVAPSSLENANVGVESFVGPLGPESIVVSGGEVSTA